MDDIDRRAFGQEQFHNQSNPPEKPPARIERVGGSLHSWGPVAGVQGASTQPQAASTAAVDGCHGEAVGATPPVCNTGGYVARGGGTKGEELPQVFAEQSLEANQDLPAMTYGIDWLRASVPQEGYDDLVGLVERYWGKLQAVPRGLWGYTDSLLGLGSVRVVYCRDADFCKRRFAGRIVLEAPGGAMQALDLGDVQNLVQELRAMFGEDLKFTRLDPKIDDHARSVGLHDLRAAVTGGHFSGFKRTSFDVHESGDGGWTVSLGKRGAEGSGRYLRVYDKTVESCGEIDAVRWEVEFSRKYADSFGQMLAHAENLEAFGALIRGAVVGSVEFCEASTSTDRHTARRPRVGWWAALIKGIEAVSVSVKKKLTTLDDSRKYIEKQVASTLGTMRLYLQAVGGNLDTFNAWLADVVDGGLDRLQPRHKAKLLAAGVRVESGGSGALRGVWQGWRGVYQE